MKKSNPIMCDSENEFLLSTKLSKLHQILIACVIRSELECF